MPTTRSQGRHEPLQELETPAKRQRKTKKAPVKPKEPRIRAYPISPEAEVPHQQEPRNPELPVPAVLYCHASTQTEDIVILTVAEAAELRERAINLLSPAHKRNRDDESEDEPVAKRQQFSTPQNNKPNNLWMFGEGMNGNHPRTAPSKSFGASSSRRPLRGPLNRRSNLAGSPRNRPNPTTTTTSTYTTTSTTTDHSPKFDRIKPIEQEAEKEDTENQTNGSQQEAEATQEQSQSHPQSLPPQTPRRGLFGSLRGMVHKGWDMATSLSPLVARTEPRPVSQSLSRSDQVSYPQIQAGEEDFGVHVASYNKQAYSSNAAQHQSARPNRRILDLPRPSSRYDHLHYIPADAMSINKAASGEIEPPESPPTPPSPMSRIKAQNPGMSDAMIASILRQRARKKALDEARYGPPPKPKEITVAPLFGPDSHYARGTIDPRFVPPTSPYSPKKRKLESVNGKVPPPKNGGVGIDDEYLDVDTEIESVDQASPPEEPEEPDVETPSAKRQKTDLPNTNTVPATPRSAMKKPGSTGSVNRKSVAFGNSVSRDIRGHYGPAGQYKGSTFADADENEDSRSLSSIDHSDIISPTIKSNTLTNTGTKPVSVLDNLGADIPTIDFTLRDPNDEKWRPSLANPRPGVFRVPDIDEEDPDESMMDVTPEQPQTPRMSHAELPAAPSTIGSVSFNESSIVNESTELALDKARSKAEKYKPKSSSRLSEVSRARSRSTSPDDEEEDQTTPTPQQATAPAVLQVNEPPQPFVPRELNNSIEGSDGMTDYEREHQYDDWAANLKWDAPQTYEDAGTGSAFIHNLIRKNWTEADSRRSENFWAKEFQEVNSAMEDAKAKGESLVLVTGMEDIEGY